MDIQVELSPQVAASVIEFLRGKQAESGAVTRDLEIAADKIEAALNKQ